MPKAYYNEHDKQAAAWLRELIKQGVITDGEVDERSIEDVVPAELAEFDRVHMFAGIGCWDYALNQAGWPDGGGQVWTGSCPCQPFSAAGKGDGFDDERHLWPAWFHLIEQCRPRTIFGEQVSSKDAMSWFDLVSADLEGALYTVGAADLCSPSVGAPHIRQRLFFVAESNGSRNRPNRQKPKSAGSDSTKSGRSTDVVADSERRRCGKERNSRGLLNQLSGKGADKPLPITERSSTSDVAESAIVGRRGRCDGDTPGDGGEIQIEGRGPFGELADSERRGCGKERNSRGLLNQLSGKRPNQSLSIAERGPTNGFWRDAEWVWCRDEKYRPTKPGIFPLANGIAGRVGILRGAGNAIVAPLAIAWIESYLK